LTGLMSNWASRAVLKRALHPRALAAFLIVCTVGFVTVTGALLWELRRQTWNSSMRAADNLVAAVAQDIGRNVELYDLSLAAVIDGLAMPRLDQLNSTMRQALLFDRAATAKYLGSILVLDDTGAVIEDAGSVPPRSDNLSNRSYFQVHRQATDVGLFISEPFRRHLTGNGDWVIALSRRIDKPDGSFGGVVVGTLRLDYFKEVFGKFRLGKRDAVSLFRSDGTLLVRAPFDDRSVGRRFVNTTIVQKITAAPSGQFIATASLDGVTRAFSFKRVDAFPLILFVAQPPADIFAAWWRWAVSIVAILAVMSVVTGMLAWVCHSELRRRFRAEAVMRHREEELRLIADHATDVIVRLDPTMIRRFVSPSCQAVFGCAPDQLLGQDFRETIYPEDREATMAIVEEARRTHGRGSAVYRIVRQDGGLIWVEGQFSAMPGDGGFAVLVRDISARKAAERDLAETHEELRRAAATDSLTGLANRRRFDETINQEWRRAAREERPITLLLLDVDQFKRFNDHYGHQGGDACLRAVAQVLAGCARQSSDLVARYGGEEFAVLLPDTDRLPATELAERFRTAIIDLQVPHVGNAEHGSVVSASFGAATTVPRQRSSAECVDEDLRGFISACDQALYEAKRSGRNQVAFSADDCSLSISSLHHSSNSDRLLIPATLTSCALASTLQ